MDFFLVPSKMAGQWITPGPFSKSLGSGAGTFQGALAHPGCVWPFAREIGLFRQQGEGLPWAAPPHKIRPRVSVLGPLLKILCSGVYFYLYFSGGFFPFWIFAERFGPKYIPGRV